MLHNTHVTKGYRSWDLKPSHSEFGYNHSHCVATSLNHFKVVYEFNPCVNWSPTKYSYRRPIKKWFDKSNARYVAWANKSFEVAELVSIHLRKERFLYKRKNTLTPWNWVLSRLWRRWETMFTSFSFWMIMVFMLLCCGRSLSILWGWNKWWWLKIKDNFFQDRGRIVSEAFSLSEDYSCANPLNIP